LSSSDDVAYRDAELRDLRLFGKSFKISSRFVLPRLRSLTIGHTSACVLLPILSPTALPALRSLAMPDTHEGNFKELRRSRIADLSGQLDAMFLSAPVRPFNCTYTPADYFPAATFPCTLFDSWIEEISRFTGNRFDRPPRFFLGPTSPQSRPMVHHLRIRGETSAAKLQRLVPWIERDGSGLKSIYLSPEWHHHASPLSLEKLIKICHEKSIDVIYEVQDVGWASSYMSDEFCRRQREVRRLEAARTVEMEE